MVRVDKLGIFILVLVVSFWKCHTLRCQLEDGPSEEELKKVVRICMRKLGGSSDRNDSESSYEDSNSNESYDNRRSSHRDNNNSNNNNNNNNNNNGNRGNRFSRDTDRWQQHDNSYGNRNQQRYDTNGYGNNGNNGNNGFNYGNDYGNNGYPNNEQNRNYNMSNRNRNDSENDGNDKSCMIQCFFQEMKMTNSDGFPDKHKVERIVTQDVRDREMKNFLLDSVQECFHIVEMERRRDKCVFAKNIVSCLAERARANCEDYYNETMIF